MDSKGIGQSIRELREEAGVGLRELGRLAEVSAASLNAIEKGQTNPTLATLHKILKALGTDFAEFFTNSAQRNGEPVFARKDMKVAVDAHREYVFITPKKPGLRFQMVHETIGARERRTEWEVHDCDVGGVILSGGPARLEIDGQGCWILRKGDSFYVKAGSRHRLINTGKRTIRQITVMDPPKY